MIAYKLGENKSPIVANTALATFQQMVVSIFEKLQKEDLDFEKEQLEGEIKARLFLNDSLSLFQVY
jgi:hypothetical protein